VSFPPLVTPPAQPLDLEAEAPSALPRTIGRMVGEGRVRDAVGERALRPADLDSAEMGPVESIWIPLWRVKGSADSFSLDIVSTVETIRELPDAGVLGGGGRRPPDSRRRKGRTRTRRRTRPVGGFRHHDSTLSIPARRGLAPSAPGGMHAAMPARSMPFTG